MWCPEIRIIGNTECAGPVCVYYADAGEFKGCLKALDIKARLEILTQEEKAALVIMRKGKR
jgi:hypothetical protein